MPDPRVTHLWDEQRIASLWFAQHVDETQNLVWDTYLLYGPEAKWESNGVPGPLISSGYTVLRKRGELQASILPLLREGSKP